MAKNKRIRFSRKFWRDLGNYAISLIKTDARNGVLQGDKESDHYINNRKYPYSAYKNNGMRAFSTGNSLLRYEGRKIVNTDTSRVNMELTGHLLEHLHTNVRNAKGFEITYDLDDEMKVKGNEFYGRSVTDLSFENSDKVADVVFKEFGKQIAIFTKDDIVINVGLKI